MQLPLFFPQLLLFGDSIVEKSVQTPRGIIPQLQKQYSGVYDVVNRGFEGYGLYDAGMIVEPVFNGLGKAPIEWAILVFGTDNLARGEDLVGYYQQLDLINLASVAESRSRNIVIVGPGLINEDLVNGTNFDLYQFNEEAKAIAYALDWHFVDLWSIFRTYLDEDPDVYSIEDFGPPLEDGPEDSDENYDDDEISTMSRKLSSNKKFAFYAKATNQTHSGGANQTRAGGSNETNGIPCTISDSNYTLGAHCSKVYDYVGEKGNPENNRLDALLTDGVHYTDLAYGLLLDALRPILNGTKPKSVVPSYSTVNSTEVLPAALAEDYVTAAAANAESYLAEIGLY